MLDISISRMKIFKYLKKKEIQQFSQVGMEGPLKSRVPLHICIQRFKRLKQKWIAIHQKCAESDFCIG